MGRAQGKTADGNGRFDAVLGSRRGASRLDLGAKRPDEASRAHAHALGTDVLDGRFDEALRELKLLDISRRDAPLAAGLARQVIRSVDVRTRLDRRTREILIGVLGIERVVAPAAQPTPAALDRELRKVLTEELERDGGPRVDALLSTASRLHRRAFSLGLAHEIQRGYGGVIFELLGEPAEAEMTLANLPGVPDSQSGLQRAQWAVGMFAPITIQGLLESALDASDPAAALRDRLPSMLYEAAHERAENDSR